MQFTSTLRNIIAIAVLTSVAVTAHAQNPLSPAMGFNVMVRENLTVSSNETDGPMAVGGNFIIKGGYQVNIHEVGTYKGTGSNIIGLYVGNQVIFESGNTVKIGNGRYVKIGNLSNTDVSNGNNQTESTRILKKGSSRDSNPRIELALTQPIDKVPIGAGEKIDFETIYKNFEVSSQNISLCSSNTTLLTPNGDPMSATNIPSHGQVRVVLKANTVNVLNISGDDLNRINSIGFAGSVSRPDANTPFVINVNVNGTFNWKPFNFTGIGDQEGQFILFNFHQTSKILLTDQNNTIKGSLLAPSADVVKSISSNIDGQVIARSYDQSGGENHYQLFNANVPGCKENSLPVELSYFKAEANNQQQAVLSWGTAQEVNSAYFIVEKSRDGKSFEGIRTVAAKGQSKQAQAYTFVDQQATYGVNYYRLRQMDTDGRSQVFRSVSVIIDSPENRLFSVYPNPNRGEAFSVRVQDETTQLQLQTLQGVRVPVQISPTSQELRVNPTQSLVPGTYVLRIQDRSGVYARKIVIL